MRITRYQTPGWADAEATMDSCFVYFLSIYYDYYYSAFFVSQESLVLKRGNQSSKLKRHLVRRKWRKKDDNNKNIAFIEEDVKKVIGVLSKRCVIII